MEVRNLHPWKVKPSQARLIQERLRYQVKSNPPPRLPRLVAGADVSYNRFGPDLYAAVVVLDLESLQTIEEVRIVARATFPYIPGLLSFREIPPLIRIFRRLRTLPDAVICDGQGLAHPRRFGLACHLGLILEIPSIGCAKSRLVGDYVEPGAERGKHSPLKDINEVIGSVLRTRSGIRPVFVSVGHRVSLEMAREIVLRLTLRYRLPETTRRAHFLVNDLRLKAMQNPSLRGLDRVS